MEEGEEGIAAQSDVRALLLDIRDLLRNFEGREGTQPRQRITAPALPEPRFVRAMIRQRRARERYFGDLFADPAWDMLLDLAAARAEHQRVSVTSACIAANVPATTALRYLKILVDRGFVTRSDDTVDGRRAFVNLTAKGESAIARYFHDCFGTALSWPNISVMSRAPKGIFHGLILSW